MRLKVGMLAPDFVLPDQSGNKHSLKNYRGKWIVLYFYPKDDTPGCTVEACAFRDRFSVFKRADVVILGASVDPVKKHVKFSEKYDLKFPLLSDEERLVVTAYGVWGKKKFMGREYMGTNRATFLIDPKGKIRKIYDAVKPADHAEEILTDLKSFQRTTL